MPAKAGIHDFILIAPKKSRKISLLPVPRKKVVDAGLRRHDVGKRLVGHRQRLFVLYAKNRWRV